MDTNDDPFPSSLPRILDTSMTQELEGHGLDFDPMLYDSQNFFSSSYQSPHKSNGTGVLADSTGLAPLSTQSPESLPDSSSSGSSRIEHNRNLSAESSRSGALDEDVDTHMADYPPGAKAIAIGASPIEARAMHERSPSPDLDTSNRAMESHFDFDSAASSPNTYLDMMPNSTSIRPKTLPPRSFPNFSIANGTGLYSGRPKGSRETSPLSMMMKNQGSWSATAEQPQQLLINASDTFVNGAMLDRPLEGLEWPIDVPPEAPKLLNPGKANMFHQPTMAKPFASPAPIPSPLQHPTLLIDKLPQKSRVETQIPVKLTLCPVPQGVTKLHLQPYTLSKAKLVAKPTPKKSPEMLELHAMLVCSSAMQDKGKLARAFARAAGPQPIIPVQTCRSSLGDSTSPEDDENKPINGGPVHICGGCIERERKRAGRKKLKNPEEEQEWQKDEAKRTVVFNTQEVKDWVKPLHPKNEEGNHQSFRYSDNDVEIDIPMRIACYCRHQEEKVGFQVMFTLKDHKDKVLAQAISESIVITDDHKTHGPPSAMPASGATFPDGVVVSGIGVFSQAPTHNQGPTLFRQSYSTNDLQNMQQQFNAQHISPYAMPQYTSQTTSAILTPTPKTLSRQASPSAPSGQQHKRRKASSSGRVRANDLAMTKLQTPSGPTFPNTGVSSAGQPLGPGPREAPGFASTYVPPSGLPMQYMPLQYNTNPSTPSTADGACFSPTQRSQSMENLQAFSGVLSAPNSTRPSRVPSPTLEVQSSGMQQINAQMLTNSLHSASRVVQPHQPSHFPVINKLTPSEGSKLGGMEVTCLGSGFRQGLEVMFGDSQATTTTYWGENAICCLVPPASQAGTVPVTFKHNYEQRAVSPPNKLAVFRYIDDDEQELMKHALTLVNRQWNGGVTDASDSARHIINMFGASASFMGGLPQGGSNQGSSHQRTVSSSSIAMAGMTDLESATLNCLNLVDLDDSPHQANLNAQGRNGQSMLHLSASLGYYRLTAGLLARGANPDIRDKNGLSPMHLASLRGHPRTIRKLRSAGADPTLRTLNGFTPADMATSEQTYDASDTLDHHTRSRSVAPTPRSHLSRASSAMSFQSSRVTQTRLASADTRSGTFEDEKSVDEVSGGVCRSQPMTPAQAFARSRRNSLAPEQEYLNEEAQDEVSPYASMFATNPAMSAWRDQLGAQIQQLQQSMHRTLPNLPIPNLPDYQTYPVVKRISQMVPQRNSRPSTAIDSSEPAKENDYHWWELLTWQNLSPPAYEEIYPENSERDMSGKKASILRAVGEALLDRKSETNLDRAESSSVIDTVDFGSSSLTKSQREQLRTAHAKKMKKLRSDRKLFLIWIPLLVLVLGAMLKDRIPQLAQGTRLGFVYVRERFHGRIFEVV